MVAGLSRWVIRSTPPDFCAQASGAANVRIATTTADSLSIVASRYVCRGIAFCDSVRRVGKVNSGVASAVSPADRSVTKLTEKPFVDVTRLTCDLHGRHNIAVDTTRSLTSTS